MNLPMKHSQRTDFVVAKGEGGGGGMEWELRVNRCKL